MSCYVIAVGGTGNKILESIVYAACADAFYAADGTPIPEIRLLSVDVDAACGNTTRAKRAAEYYEQVRSTFAASPFERRCFHTRLRLTRWNMNLSRRASSVRQMSQNHSQDELLARTLFSSTEAQLEYSEGFRGHPDLGVLFFADLLSTLDEKRAQGQPDEFNALLDEMEADMARGETVHVMLCGSVFGGTGASGIPAISKYLHNRYQENSKLFVMGSMLMLPYYKVPPANVNPEEEIAVDSDEFLDKARTALQYYGMESMIRDHEDDPSGVFDAVYLLGLPPEHFVSTRLYSTGSQSQENDAHMLEWLASRCIARFMRTGFRGADAHNIDCYYYQWHTPAFGWASFDDDAALYQSRYGAMIKAAAAYFAECYPTLKQHVLHGGLRTRRVNYVAAFFRRLHRMPAAKRALAEEHLDALYHFFVFYVRWMRQLILSLPPAMQTANESEGILNAALLEKLDEVIQTGGKSACIQLEKNLNRLVSSAVPDRCGMSHVLCGLGGAECPSREPTDAFACFLTALMDAVWEDMKA